MRLRGALISGLLILLAGGVVAGALALTSGTPPPRPDDEHLTDTASNVAPEDGSTDRPEASPEPEPAPDVEIEADPPTEVAPDPEPEPEPVLPPGPPSDERALNQAGVIYGNISPKSVVASPDGLVFAQNMMYRHTITVYDRDRELVATISDTVNLSELGLDGPDADLRGSPVEAAFSPDGRYAYVSNYKMYGPGFTRGGTDTCSPADRYDDSFLYRIDTQRLEIDQAIGVGSVPKYVATTPDGRYVLVSNWCSYDLSVIDTTSAEELARIDVGRYPRGIAVSPDASTAYIALMGSTRIVTLDLDDLTLGSIDNVGVSPRHLVISPDGGYLYATLNAEGVVIRLDLTSEEIVRVSTGRAPRSMAIAADGRSLYVVNYLADTVSKVRTSDMTVVQSVPTDERPIGVTYDAAAGDVWVANYSGSIQVFEDR